MKIHRNNDAVQTFVDALGEKDMVVLVHAPWCHHCKTFLPTFQKAIKTLDGVANTKVIELKDSDVASCMASGKNSKLKAAIFSAVHG